MKHIDIMVLSRFSGIKAHTIRAWELRYHILNPSRTKGNRRVYSKDDVCLILDLSLLSRYGYSISTLASLSPIKLKENVHHLILKNDDADISLYQLLSSFIKGDITTFEVTLIGFLKRKGSYDAVTNLVSPFLQRSGIISYIDTQNRTHLAVTALRKIILYATQDISHNENHNCTVLLFLPKNQHFDLILLYISYHLQFDGFHVLYLGTNITLINLKEAIEEYNPDLLVTYVPSENDYVSKDLLEFSEGYIKKPMLIATAESHLQAKDDSIIHYQTVTKVARKLCYL